MYPLLRKLSALAVALAGVAAVGLSWTLPRELGTALMLLVGVVLGVQIAKLRSKL